MTTGINLMLNTVKKVAHQHFQGARGSHDWDHNVFMEEFFKRFIEENQGKR